MSELKYDDIFDCEGAELTIMDDEPDIIKNPFSGEKCELCPEAIAVYDYIKGAEQLGSPYHKQLAYFQKKWPKEYYILLD